MSLMLVALVAAVAAPQVGDDDALRSALVRRALGELHLEQFEAALASATELRQRFPADPAGPLTEANVFQTLMRDYRLRDHEPQFLAALAEARRLAESRVRTRRDAEALFARATARGYVAIHDYRSGRWLAAFKQGLRCLGDMEQAARLDPGFVDPQLPIALHDYWKSRKLSFLFAGRRGEAIARMELVWREGRYLSVEAAYSLSTVLQLEGAFGRALSVNDWLAERFPDNPVNLYNRARILEGLERPVEAMQAWDQLVARLVASGRVSHGFLAECELARARLFAASPSTSAHAQTGAALTLAREHARERDPEREMEGPFEDFDEVRGTIARLEASWSKSGARLRASR